MTNLPTCFVTLVIAGLLVTGCAREASRPAPPSRPAVPVRTTLVEEKPQLAFEEVVGTVRSRLRSTIEAKTSARIEKMLAVPGMAVKGGDLLVQLDGREIQSRLDQAKPVLRNTETEVKRFKSLIEQNAVSKSEYDAVEAKFRVAQAAVAEAETMLGYTRIEAPFAGVITRKLADVGDVASPGRALLELEDPHALRLEADVPESLIGVLQLGARIGIGVQAGEHRTEGVVSEIAPAADSATRTFLVKIDLPPAANWRAGQFARAAIPLGASNSLRVPSSVLIQRGQMELVFVAAGNTAELRLVKSGKCVGDEVEVVSGLSRGERVVVEGAAQLRDGQSIEIKP